MSEIFDKILKSITPDARRYVELSDEIAAHIHSILEEKKMTQKDLAKILNKKESEISKWLAGNHNFTLKTIAKLESALGCDLIFTKEKVSKISSSSYVWSVSIHNAFSGELLTEGGKLNDFDDSEFSYLEEDEAA